MAKRAFENAYQQIEPWLKKHFFDICIVCGLFTIFYFPPLFVLGSIRLSAVHVVGGCSILYLLWKLRFLQLLKVRKNLVIVGGFVLLLAYGGALMVLHGTGLSGLSSQLYYLVDVIPFALVMVDYVKKKDLSADALMHLLVVVGMLQAICAVLTMILPPMKNLLIQMLLDYGYGDVIWLTAHRMFGFSGQLTHATPILQSFLAVLAFYLCFEKSRKYYVAVFLMMGTAIFNARLSVVTFGLGALMVLCCAGRWGGKRVWHTLKVLLILLPVFAVGVVALNFVMPQSVEWLRGGLQEILAIFAGKSESTTLSQLLSAEWLVLPKGNYLLFGVGSNIMYGYENEALGIAQINSDVGYINDIWYGGLVYAALLYAVFAYGMQQLRSKCHVGAVRFMGVFLAVVMPLLNIKGMAFTMQGYSNFIVILAIVMANWPEAAGKETKDGR